MSSIPCFPHFRAISIDDKAFFQETLSQSPPQISEHTFTNLFIWNYFYHFLWCRWEDVICVMAQPDGKGPFLLPPIGSGLTAERIYDLLRGVEQPGIKSRMCRVPEHIIREQLAGNNRFIILPDRDNSDYVYRTEDLIKLEGNRYHGKKNRINKFKKNHRYQYAPLTADLVEQCLALESAWCDIRQCALYPGLAGEERAIYEALTHMQQLDCTGGVILINGKVEAFALGELLNPDTAVIHIEKANPAFEGLYQLINQEFCANHWAHIPFVNREQDLGEEGLRKAKLSYHPHHLVHKYTILLAESN